jgi:phosphoglycolate phosphatase-like HAD superfamily hydrolase
MSAPRILALDFDGVICDTVHECVRPTWQVYREIWGASGDGPPPDAVKTFIHLRPAVEIGWEFPILLRAILEGVPEAALLREFQTIWRPRVLEAHRLSQADLAVRFDAARDDWIRTDLQGWIASNRFYPGIADRLRAILRGNVHVFILTTKEGRFAHMLLEANGVTLPPARVWGKERARPKADLIRVLHQEQAVNYGDIWFVEDRLKTLRAVQQQADLEAVGLFLATWGYNTPAERDEAAADRRIVPLTLQQFCGDFPIWTRSPTEGAVARGAAT